MVWNEEKLSWEERIDSFFFYYWPPLCLSLGECPGFCLEDLLQSFTFFTLQFSLPSLALYSWFLYFIESLLCCLYWLFFCLLVPKCRYALKILCSEFFFFCIISLSNFILGLWMILNMYLRSQLFTWSLYLISRLTNNHLQRDVPRALDVLTSSHPILFPTLPQPCLSDYFMSVNGVTIFLDSRLKLSTS